MNMPKWTAANISDQTGKRAIVTGGNSGIGLSAARELARAGARVTIGSRDAGRGNAAADAIRAAIPSAKIDSAVLDLADLSSIRTFAESQNEPLDLLINNAGVMAPKQRKTTADGFELQFGTNHLGHFALTGRLVPLLSAAPAARVVTVSSIAHRNGQIYFDDLQAEKSYDAFARYRQSKLANLLFGFELQRWFERTGRRASSIVVHPGVTKSNLFLSGMGAHLGFFAKPMSAFVGAISGQATDKGALPTLYAATSPDAKGGAYYGPDGIKEIWGYPSPAVAEPPALDEAAARRLWDVSQTLTGVFFP